MFRKSVLALTLILGTSGAVLADPAHTYVYPEAGGHIMSNKPVKSFSQTEKAWFDHASESNTTY